MNSSKLTRNTLTVENQTILLAFGIANLKIIVKVKQKS